jgi:hypothetical protein
MKVTISVTQRGQILRQRMTQRFTLPPEGPVQARSSEPLWETS